MCSNRTLWLKISADVFLLDEEMIAKTMLYIISIIYRNEEAHSYGSLHLRMLHNHISCILIFFKN